MITNDNKIFKSDANGLFILYNVKNALECDMNLNFFFFSFYLVHLRSNESNNNVNIVIYYK